MPKLVVGLGNPGPRYAQNRHNVGFMVIDQLAGAWGTAVTQTGHKGQYGEARFQGDKVILLKPSTYMNLSGQSVTAALSWYKLKPEDLLVVYDDLDLPPGKLRLRLKGSAGGHNGIKSLIQELGTQEFARVKVGIGRPLPGWQVVDWVLGNFSADEKPLVQAAVEQAAGAVEAFLREGPLKAMNQFNQD